MGKGKQGWAGQEKTLSKKGGKKREKRELLKGEDMLQGGAVIKKKNKGKIQERRGYNKTSTRERAKIRRDSTKKVRNEKPKGILKEGPEKKKLVDKGAKMERKN